MKVTIEPEALLKMISVARVKAPEQKRSNTRLCFSACDGMAYVEANKLIAGVAAMVEKGGACRVPLVKFADVLATYPPNKTIVIEVDKRGLHIGGFTMPVTAYTAVATLHNPTNRKRPAKY
jgi:hypothetical protein